MNDLDQYYKVLGLLPGASPEEITQAYKDLAFIWHPDRIPKDNTRLHQKAEEKIKEINLAREKLRSIQPRGQNQNTQHRNHPRDARAPPRWRATRDDRPRSRATPITRRASGRRTS